MPKLIGFLIAAMLAAPSLALNSNPGEETPSQGTRPQPKPSTTTLAHKLVVLERGRPLTKDDKRTFATQTAAQFRSTPGVKTTTPAPRKTDQPSSASPATETISPAQMVSSTLVGAAYEVPEWDPADAMLMMGIGPDSFMGIQVFAAPNMIYVMTVRAQTSSAAPHFTIYAMQRSQITSMPSQTVTGSPGNTEFAFAFDTTGSGSVTFVVSADCPWYFLSAELMPSPE
jgi:hypothetical protein